MDRKDRKILDILKDNGRASYTEIAEELNVSEGTIRNRIEKMKKNGVIQRFTVEVSEDQVSAIMLLKLKTSADPGKMIEKLPKGLNVYEVTGKHDVVVTFERATPGELNDTLDRIRGIKGVEDTVTKSVLNETRT